MRRGGEAQVLEQHHRRAQLELEQLGRAQRMQQALVARVDGGEGPRLARQRAQPLVVEAVALGVGGEEAAAAEAGRVLALGRGDGAR